MSVDRRQRLISVSVIALVVLVAVGWAVLPGILRALPPRYVARLPEPIQVLVREPAGTLVLTPVVLAADTHSSALDDGGRERERRPAGREAASTVDRAARFVRRFRRHLRTLERISGLFLIVIGLMMLTNQMALIAIWAQRNRLYFDLPFGGTATPTYLIAMAAGLLSFLSLCVLPLVPAYISYLSGHAIGGLRHVEN